MISTRTDPESFSEENSEAVVHLLGRFAPILVVLLDGRRANQNFVHLN
jgi:hypothetical protein